MMTHLLLRRVRNGTRSLTEQIVLAGDTSVINTLRERLRMARTMGLLEWQESVVVETVTEVEAGLAEVARLMDLPLTSFSSDFVRERF